MRIFPLILLPVVFILLTAGHALNRTQYLDFRYNASTMNSTYLKASDGSVAVLWNQSSGNPYYPENYIYANFTGNLTWQRSWIPAGSWQSTAGRKASQAAGLFAEADLNVTGFSMPLITGNLPGEGYRIQEWPFLYNVRFYANQSTTAYTTISGFNCSLINSTYRKKPLEECVIDFYAPPVANLTDLSIMPAGSFLKIEWENFCKKNATNGCYGDYPAGFYGLGLANGTNAIYSRHDNVSIGYYPCGLSPSSHPDHLPPSAWAKGKYGLDGCGGYFLNMTDQMGQNGTFPQAIWPNSTDFSKTYQNVGFECYSSSGAIPVFPYFGKGIYNIYGFNTSIPKYQHLPNFTFDTYQYGYYFNMTNLDYARCDTDIGEIIVPPEPEYTGCDEFFHLAQTAPNQLANMGFGFSYLVCRMTGPSLAIFIGIALGVFVASIGGFIVMAAKHFGR